MSFREKTAWITLVTLLVCFGGYFGVILSGVVPQKSAQALHLAIAAIFGVALLQIALNLIAMRVTPRDSMSARDERELMIHARSHVVGYYVLMIGTAATLVITHIRLADDGFVDIIVRTVNVGVFFMALAAVSVAAAQIVMLRRGY